MKCYWRWLKIKTRPSVTIQWLTRHKRIQYSTFGIQEKETLIAQPKKKPPFSTTILTQAIRRNQTEVVSHKLAELHHQRCDAAVHVIRIVGCQVATNDAGLGKALALHLIDTCNRVNIKFIIVTKRYKPTKTQWFPLDISGPTG